MRHERIDPSQGSGNGSTAWAGPIYVRDVMSPPGKAPAGARSAPVVSVAPESSLDEALHLMTDRSIAALPVVQGGQVIGILRQSDVVAALARRQSR